MSRVAKCGGERGHVELAVDAARGAAPTEPPIAEVTGAASARAVATAAADRARGSAKGDEDEVSVRRGVRVGDMNAEPLGNGELKSLLDEAQRGERAGDDESCDPRHWFGIGDVKDVVYIERPRCVSGDAVVGRPVPLGPASEADCRTLLQGRGEPKCSGEDLCKKERGELMWQPASRRSASVMCGSVGANVELAGVCCCVLLANCVCE